MNTFNKEKTMLAFGIIIAVGILVFLIWLFFGAGHSQLVNPAPVTGLLESPQASVSGFESSSPLYGSLIPSSSRLPTGGPVSPLAGVQSVDDLKKLFPELVPQTSPSPAASTVPILDLPNVSDSEISVSSSGAASVSEYIQALASISASFTDLRATFDSLPKDSQGVPIFPSDIIQQALNSGSSSGIQNSLQSWTNVDSRLALLYGQIKVQNIPGVVTFDKQIIGFTKLQNGLEQKGIDWTKGLINSQEMQAYLNQFAATKSYYHDQLSSQVGVLAKNSVPFVNTAYAAGPPPFGGQITYMQICCNGILLTLTPPTPGLYMVYWAFLASPLFYMFHTLHPGVWLLGLYVPPGVCLTGAYCATTIPAIGSIIMAGTSQ